MSQSPGRNDPCPCGSGRKYKNCCQGESTMLSSTTWTAVLIAIALVVGAFVIGQSLLGEDTAAVECPAGQVWSEAHGHCH